MRRQPSRWVLVVPALAFTLTARAPVEAIAQDACDVLGTAGYYYAVATEGLQTRSARGLGSIKSPYYYYYYPAWPVLNGSVCAGKISAGKDGQWYGDLVATADSKITIKFGFSRGGFTDHLIRGDVITGGGGIKVVRGTEQDLDPDGVIDTSGTHPLVAECAEAIASLKGISQALALGLLPGEPPEAARPQIDLGDIEVDREDELLLTSTQPVTFYKVRDLRLRNGRYYYYDRYRYVGVGGALYVDSSGLVVINVTGRLDLGRASILGGDGRYLIINAVGRGPGIKMKILAETDAQLLAPERTVRVLARGGGTTYFYGETAGVFARKVSFKGSANVGGSGQIGDACRPSPLAAVSGSRAEPVSTVTGGHDTHYGWGYLGRLYHRLMRLLG